MAFTSAERSDASRIRAKKPSRRTDEEKQRLDSFEERKGKPGRKPKDWSPPPLFSEQAEPAPASSAPAEPPPPPPAEPAPSSSSSGTAPPIEVVDLGADPKAEEEKREATQAEKDQQRMLLAASGAALVVQGMRAVEPIIRREGFFCLPDVAITIGDKTVSVYGAVEYSWTIVLDKLIQAAFPEGFDVNPVEAAAVIAVGSSGFQFTNAYLAWNKQHKRGEKKPGEVASSAPVPPAAAAEPRPAREPAKPAAPPPNGANGAAKADAEWDQLFTYGDHPDGPH